MWAALDGEAHRHIAAQSETEAAGRECVGVAATFDHYTLGIA